MALHNFSFIVVTPEKYENCQKAEVSAGAATKKLICTTCCDGETITCAFGWN
jgi:hypothetical protein